MSKERLMRGVVCAALALAASWALWGRAARTSAQGPPRDGDKPVEQTRKNIQVLKGLPESQLFPEMNFIAASLGVQCGFCHVNTGRDPQTGRTNWVWESDEKEQKKIAREMMRMVLAVGKGDYGISRGQVTCYTCHRGQEHPPSLPALPLAVSGHEPAPGAVPTPAPGAAAEPAQPTVQQVFDRYAAAVGKPEAVARFRTQSVKGQVLASQNRSQAFELTMKAPDKALLVVQQGGVAVRRALSGTTGWMTGPRGNSRGLGPDELAEARRVADMLGVFKFTPSPTMRVGELGKVGARDAVVVVDRPSEAAERRYFFDAETGLLLRIVTLTDAVLNQIPEQTDFEDYREVEGVKVPFRIVVSSIDTFFSRTQTITEVKPGVPVEDSIFEMPKQQ